MFLISMSPRLYASYIHAQYRYYILRDTDNQVVMRSIVNIIIRLIQIELNNLMAYAHDGLSRIHFSSTW